MAEHFFINMFSKDDCKKYVDVIDSLSDQWTKRTIGVSHYYTFGAASHLDLNSSKPVTDDILEFIKINNNNLKSAFPDIYDKIILELSKKIGPCELIEEGGPVPGIFIYGEARPNNIKKEDSHVVGGLASIHTDGQVAALNYIWNKYDEVSTEYISYTLPLEMPENGAAFLLWDQPDLGCYMDGEIADIYKSYNYYQDEKNINFLNNNITNKVPEIIDHVLGRMLVQKGEQFHAAGFSTKPFTTDRRITFQGLGAKCDGVWRLFF
jgi:hypothetical protein